MKRLIGLPAVLLFLVAGFSIAFADDAPVPGGRLLRDVAYGSDPALRFDVYLPARPVAAPLVVMVHGGGWRNGDKALPSVVGNKARHWLAQGFIFVSVNNRLLPAADPLVQSQDVAHALAEIQRLAPGWGGDPARVILAGHSAGAHLVDLLAADPARAYALGALPWRGTLSLDSGAIDTVGLMRLRHAPLFDDAFGADPDFWRATSPLARLTAQAPPFLLVCSSPRRASCGPNRAFAQKAQGLGVAATVLPVDLSHREINVELGLPGAYTDSVDAFLRAALQAGP